MVESGTHSLERSRDSNLLLATCIGFSLPLNPLGRLSGLDLEKPQSTLLNQPGDTKFLPPERHRPSVA